VSGVNPNAFDMTSVEQQGNICASSFLRIGSNET
jgi:hypothetical protein